MLLILQSGRKLFFNMMGSGQGGGTKVNSENFPKSKIYTLENLKRRGTRTVNMCCGVSFEIFDFCYQ